MDDVRVKLWIVTVLLITINVLIWLVSRNFYWVLVGLGIGIVIHLVYNMMISSSNFSWLIVNFGGIVAIFGLAAAIALRDYLWVTGGGIILVVCISIALFVNA